MLKENRLIVKVNSLIFKSPCKIKSVIIYLPFNFKFTLRISRFENWKFLWTPASHRSRIFFSLNHLEVSDENQSGNFLKTTKSAACTTKKPNPGIFRWWILSRFFSSAWFSGSEKALEQAERTAESWRQPTGDKLSPNEITSGCRKTETSEMTDEPITRLQSNQNDLDFQKRFI